MKIIKRPQQLSEILKKLYDEGKAIGFVPTMGALHEGHLSLVRASRRQNDITAASIFVNPTQFGPKEDLKKYPRVFARDRQMLLKCKVDYLFFPSVQAVYPEGFKKPLRIRGAEWPRLAKGLCGKFRPGHFQGVVTVVAKLLNIVGPCRLYLGAKDYQQAKVLAQMVKDLGLKVKVCVMPAIREKDGIAMSSRNRYLSPSDRARASKISRVLFDLRNGLRKQKASLSVLRSEALRELKRHTDRIQYLEIADAETLAPLKTCRKRMVALAACFVGKTRLIDSVIIRTH